MSDDRDPWEGLPDDGYAAATRLAVDSDPAQWIRSRLVDALQDQAENGGPTTDYGRGYRHALRVAYLLAGGDPGNGSAERWRMIERDE